MEVMWNQARVNVEYRIALIHIVQLGLDFKLNTKIGLDTTTTTHPHTHH